MVSVPAAPTTGALALVGAPKLLSARLTAAVSEISGSCQATPVVGLEQSVTLTWSPTDISVVWVMLFWAPNWSQPAPISAALASADVQPTATSPMTSSPSSGRSAPGIVL